MKVKNYVKKAQKELVADKENAVLYKIKNSLSAIKDCKKTLRTLEKAHKKLLDTNVDDLETEDYEY